MNFPAQLEKLATPTTVVGDDDDDEKDDDDDDDDNAGPRARVLSARSVVCAPCDAWLLADD